MADWLDWLAWKLVEWKDSQMGERLAPWMAGWLAESMGRPMDGTMAEWMVWTTVHRLALWMDSQWVGWMACSWDERMVERKDEKLAVRSDRRLDEHWVDPWGPWMAQQRVVQMVWKRVIPWVIQMAERMACKLVEMERKLVVPKGGTMAG